MSNKRSSTSARRTSKKLWLDVQSDNNTNEPSIAIQQAKLQEWLPYRSSYLDEILHHDGLGDDAETTHCASCGVEDCFFSGLRCGDCLVDNHLALPFHCIECWTRLFFDKTSLQDLGLTIQLGHSRSSCPCLLPRPIDLLVFHVNGLHHISLTLQSKITAYDFYHTLLRLTNNSGGSDPVYCYSDFLCIIRMWRHNPQGPAGTKPGELVIQCPACPHPGCNLPEGWADALAAERHVFSLLWLYTLFLAIDASFHQKLKDRDVKDINLLPGLSYFVHEKEYFEYLDLHADEEEVTNTCNGKGHIASGVGAVVCGHHGLVRKAGDLQFSEQYCNMDYIVLAALLGMMLTTLILSYNIACQWHKNFWKRVAEFPSGMRISKSSVNIGFVIPKWHLNAHGPKCQSQFSLNYRQGAGRTCAELIESNWANTNPVATSGWEMGPGSRSEMLCEQWGGWNWFIILSFDTILKWTNAVEAWEANQQSANPYEEVTSTATLNDVQLELAKEEAADIARGVGTAHEITISTFLNTGLELEEQQQLICLHAQSLKGKPTSKQLVEAVYMPCVVAQLLDSTTPDNNTTSHPKTSTIVTENICLWMPSSLPHPLHAMIQANIIQKEIRLCLRQAEDSLEEVCLNIRQKANTHMHSLYSRFNQKTIQAAERYRSAYGALNSLDPNGKWSERLRVLRKEDVRGPGKDEEEADIGEGYREPSWIWLVSRQQPSANSSNLIPSSQAVSKEDMDHTMVRAEHWEEEVALVVEEMRQVVAFMEWKAAWWCSRASAWPEADVHVQFSVTTYAEKQAVLAEHFTIRCARKWLLLLKSSNLLPPWACSYKHGASPVGIDQSDGEDQSDVEDRLDDVLEDETMSQEGDEDEDIFEWD
ncbi:hypothetical protein JAAARDRAFT_56787 [Jaapia argillacea MUCL 33604]|uniref:CxC2-like cysteine cluster KDZ transposase-associated domain-containing protein n=1 Tax=Jaapia argillacea MUCL 33604 TaxID=933084 RepID=A0A067PYN2_9AGAM|nr:hypothetical protein JAAARDRAFT_56787 [Jaapia argillacea MUCL 33604]